MPEEEIDLRTFFISFWRKKFLLLAVAVVATAIATAYVQRLTPLYRAEAEVMVDTRGAQVVEIKEVIPSLRVDLLMVETQVEIVRSRALARRVIDRLGLLQDPEFNSDLRPKKPSLLPKIDIKPLIARLTGRTETEPESQPSEQAEAMRRTRATVDAFLQKLTVNSVGKSYIITVTFEAADPEKAALIANAIVDEYIGRQIEEKRKAAQEATAWLQERLTGLRQKVISSETAVENYREEAGLVGGGKGAATDRQLEVLNGQLLTAQADRAQAEAQYRNLKKLLEKTGAIDSAPEVLSSELIRTMRGQELVLLRRISELSTRYRDGHPIMINARAELKRVQQEIEIEVQRIIDSHESTFEVARSREQNLRKALESLHLRLAADNKAEVRLRALEREVAATRALYLTFLSRFKETSQQAGLAQPDSRVVSRALAPVAPSYPKKATTVGLAFVGSLVIGCVVVLLLERLGVGFVRAEQVESLTGTRVLGLVPAAPGLVATTARTGRLWSRKNLRMYVRWLLVVSTVAVIVLSLLPQAAPPEQLDLGFHFAAYLGLAMLAMLFHRDWRIAFAAAVSMVALAGLMEVAQSFVPGRVASETDFVADCAGIVLGILVGIVIRARYKAFLGGGNGFDIDFDEAIRTLNTGLWLSNPRNQAKVLLVASSVPEEGKTVLSAAIARQAGRSGRRCLLVDGDLRAPGLHDELDAAGSPGLVDVLDGDLSFDDVVRRDCGAGLDFVASGATRSWETASADQQSRGDQLSALLSSMRMKEFLAEASTRYDLVILDSPPLVSNSDARILCRFADETVYVVRWGKTRRNIALAGLKQLRDAGGDLAGIVLSRVDRRKMRDMWFR